MSCPVVGVSDAVQSTRRVASLRALPLRGEMLCRDGGRADAVRGGKIVGGASPEAIPRSRLPFELLCRRYSHRLLWLYPRIVSVDTATADRDEVVWAGENTPRSRAGRLGAGTRGGRLGEPSLPRAAGFRKHGSAARAMETMTMTACLRSRPDGSPSRPYPGRRVRLGMLAVGTTGCAWCRNTA
jgi:hypothetical protein